MNDGYLLGVLHNRVVDSRDEQIEDLPPVGAVKRNRPGGRIEAAGLRGVGRGEDHLAGIVFQGHRYGFARSRGPGERQQVVIADGPLDHRGLQRFVDDQSSLVVVDHAHFHVRHG